jgi:hypothetical protein
MKLLNRGVNPYASAQASLLEKNSLHPAPYPICPWNLSCRYPINYVVC